ncbi:MAG: VOC family protein [Thermoanaerobaculia bacterium]
MSRPEIGSIGWVDLTVPNAEEVRDFYAQVVGWKAQGLDMGSYEDFVMASPGGEGRAGVCHARGGNAGLLPVWLVYLVVEDLDASAARCVELGGKILAPARSAGSSGRFCVIQDPAGAVAALFQGA